jgi:pyruvate dehydrogenase E1 component alpha subunit
MGTALSRSEARIDLVAKAASYGIEGAAINGMNVLAVHEAAQEAARRVRETRTPRFLELHTYRFRAHSMFDTELYRDKAEVERWKQRDPIDAFSARLRAAGLLEEGELEAMESEALAEVEAAVRFAEAGTPEPPERLLDDVVAREAPQP